MTLPSYVRRSRAAALAAVCAAGLALPARAQPAFFVLHEFAGGAEGSGKSVALVTAPSGTISSGTIYGVSGDAGTVTSCGGAPCGAVFSLTKNGPRYDYARLYNLNGSTDGAQPAGDEIVLGPDNSLYGTAPFGGTQAFPNGGGVVWRLSPPTTAGNPWTYSVLHTFDPASDPIGYRPVAGLAMDSAGVLYGSTTLGTANNEGGVFSLTPPTPPATTWTEAVLKIFARGKLPSKALRAPTLAPNELRLFGPAAAGGFIYEFHRGTTAKPWQYRTITKLPPNDVNFSNFEVDSTNGQVLGAVAPGGKYTFGEAFVVIPPAPTTQDWTLQNIFNFGASGSHAPVGTIVRGDAGQLFGTLSGTPNNIYRLDPPTGGATTWTPSVIQVLDGAAGQGTLQPNGVYPALGGALVGATLTGGAAGKGLIFRQTTH